MSIDLVAASLWLDLPPARKLVLLALCERANLTTGECWPGRAEIALRASITERSVTDHIKVLEADGWMRSGARPGRIRGMTQKRWLNSEKIIEEGERRRKDFKNRTGESFSHEVDVA